MAEYIAEPYDAAKPIVDDIAGYMYLELQALKARLNADLSAAALAQPLSTSHDELVATVAAIDARLVIIEDWQAAFVTEWAAYKVADATWKAAVDELLNTHDSTLNSHGTRITTLEGTSGDHETRITDVEARPTIIQSTTVPDNTVGNDGDIVVIY